MPFPNEVIGVGGTLSSTRFAVTSKLTAAFCTFSTPWISLSFSTLITSFPLPVFDLMLAAASLSNFSRPASVCIVRFFCFSATAPIASFEISSCACGVSDGFVIFISITGSAVSATAAITCCFTVAFPFSSMSGVIFVPSVVVIVPPTCVGV